MTKYAEFKYEVKFILDLCETQDVKIMSGWLKANVGSNFWHYTRRDDCILFKNEEDAVMFKLRFSGHASL